MISLTLGLLAALAWGVHDLLVRFLGARLVIPAALLAVLMIGTAASIPVALTAGGWHDLSRAAIAAAAASGGAYALGSACLYRAFADGPVRLVAPIIGSYPMITVALAWLTGTDVMSRDWIAVGVIVLGVALVARLSGPEAGGMNGRRAMISAAVSGVSFAAAFALAQAAARGGADWPAIMVIRAAAIGGVLMFMIAMYRRLVLPAPDQLPVLFGMGLLDAMALSVVTVAGGLPNPEYAAVVTSIFGVITVILARVFLREHVTYGQWASILVVFSGVGLLGL